MAEPYFHTTYVNRLESIAARGLVVGAARSIGAPSYDVHAASGVFLSDADGVDHWFERAQAFADDRSDSLLDDGFVPVVLRVWVDEPDKLVPDEVANQETIHADDNWISKAPIGPDAIEVWDGDSAWLRVEYWRDVDPELGVEWEDDADVDEGGYWLALTDSALLPSDEERQQDDDDD
jgi:hypothetical protein